MMRVLQSSASAFKLTGGGRTKKRPECEDVDTDEMSDFGDGDEDFLRHHSYVPYVHLTPKKPPSAVTITGLKQRYHYYPPVTPEMELQKQNETTDGIERTVSFAGAMSSSASAAVDGSDPSMDLGTAYLQSLINQMGGSKKTSSDKSTDRNKERFQFDPHASREAGLRRYCDFLHGEGIDHEKLDDFAYSGRVRSNSSHSGGGGNSRGSDKKSSLSSTSFRKQ